MTSLRLARLLLPFALLATPALAQSGSVSGTVTNKTNGKPAAGDDVVLIRLAQGMQEATRTKTDARGHYTLELPDPGIHLVRVTHDKANYFKPAPPGTTSVDLDVYNAAAHVKGIVGEADVMRIQTDEPGKSLRVVENFFVRNDSTPPMTQFSDRPFEFYLPAGAVIEGSAALAPQGMAVQAAPVPLGDPNHYAFIFPIRPGETRFQVSFHVPYSGSFKLDPKPTLTTDTVAVMLPKSMKFAASGPTSPYSAVTEEVNAQTYVARNISPSEPISFTVSGIGQIPRDTAAATGGSGQTDGQGGAEAATATTGAPTNGPGGGLGNPVDPGATNDPWAKYRWWIIGGLGLALATGAGFMLRRPSEGEALEGSAAPGTSAAGGAGSTTLGALKEELFHLETERLQGHVTEAEYTEHKLALERVLRRVLQRGSNGAGATSSPTSSAPATGQSAATPLSPDLSARSGLS